MPFIRSLSELMFITESRDKANKKSKINKFNSLTEDSGQRKRYIRSYDDKKINLPDLTKTNRPNWIKGKEAVSKFFDTLDYNNQIQSSYDITLLERQIAYDEKDAA